MHVYESLAPLKNNCWSVATSLILLIAFIPFSAPSNKHGVRLVFTWRQIAPQAEENISEQGSPIT